MLLIVRLFIAALLLVPFASLAEEQSEKEISDADIELELLNKFTGRSISIDVHDANLVEVLRIFSDAMRTNIVAHPEVAGKVNSLRLEDVPVDEAFDVMLRTYGLYAEREGSVIIVYPIESYLESMQQRIKLMRTE